VLKTGGMVDASASGTLNVLTSTDSLKISVSPNISISDSLVIMKNGKQVYSTYITLKPLQFYQKAIALDLSNSKNISVIVGKNLLSYNSDTEDIRIDRPVKSAENTDYNSAEHLFLLAEDMNAMRDFSGALNYYMECLQKEPTHSRALYKIAELHYRMDQYQKGIEFAGRILEMNTYDAGANFIYGLIQRRLGNLIKAEEAFSVAARTMEYRSGSYLQIAGIKLQKEDFAGAIEYAGKALDYNRYNITAYEVLVTSYRRLNNNMESVRILDELLEIDPLNHFARFEQYLLNPTSENLENFKSHIRNELPHETYLELSIEYANQGLNAEAIRVLEEAPSYPVVSYWLAWLNRDFAPDKSSKYLKLADEMSPYLVFPFRQETIPVLTWALTKHDSWKTRYYLGLIYWHINRPEKAMELFEQCGDSPDYAPFYLARGTLFQPYDNNYCFPCNDFNRAVMINPSEWRTWHYLNNYLQSRGAFQEQLRNSKEAYNLFPVNPVIGIDYTKALINTAHYKECLKVLERVNILPQEGAHEGHDLFELANLSQAIDLLEQKKYREAIKYINNSKNWPENLGAGKPYEPDVRFQDFLSSYCHKMTGNNNMADNYNSQIIQYSGKNWGGDREPSNIFIAYKVFNEAGKHQEAVYAMENWKTEQDSLRNWNISSGSSAPKVQWVLAKCLGEEEKSERLVKEISSGPAENRFRLILRTLSIINLKKNE
jgi:Tfp pilus assembly protein PilF